jgi:hypothetical protein
MRWQIVSLKKLKNVQRQDMILSAFDSKVNNEYSIKASITNP